MSKSCCQVRPGVVRVLTRALHRVDVNEGRRAALPEVVTPAGHGPALRADLEVEDPRHATDVEVVERAVVQQGQRVREVCVVERPVQHHESLVEHAFVALLSGDRLRHRDVPHRDVPGPDQGIQRHSSDCRVG
jgi:hypothetical protein